MEPQVSDSKVVETHPAEPMRKPWVAPELTVSAIAKETLLSSYGDGDDSTYGVGNVS